ncbi:hypothetical protein GCM10010441_71020 [Kitasatospora paracochleata]|uniref:Antitoxin VbhA domain-containing protein n=1 Tax=Kitasatospora paracochleata TaxID=58354 RepID=A0ABT1J756_9ACTN|nr:hypothetical protein [Kitasatospora paracochleata]MCP2312551.1 hypothetical protein [Kitasatospora paracochleata]
MRDGDRNGVDAGPAAESAHRLPQAARLAAARSVAASLAAEGVSVGPAAAADTEAYVRVAIDADELVARAVARHRRRPEPHTT